MEEAQRQYLDRGITISYEYMAPDQASAVDLTEALCKKLGYKGKVAILVGSVGAPCHEDRASGARDTIAKYGDMEIVATEYDKDSVDIAYYLTKKS